MRELKLACLIGSMLITPIGNAAVIDFNSLSGTGIDFNRGFTYSEDGFVLDNLGTTHPFASVHPGDFRYFGSTHFYNNEPEGVTRLTRIGGGRFSLDAIDLNSLNGDEAVTVTFTAILGNGGTATQSFTTDSAAGFETFNFGAAFSDVSAVSWTQASPFHYFDNIAVATAEIPEPGTLPLGLLATLGLVAGWRANRRAARTR